MGKQFRLGWSFKEDPQEGEEGQGGLQGSCKEAPVGLGTIWHLSPGL